MRLDAIRHALDGAYQGFNAPGRIEVAWAQMELVEAALSAADHMRKAAIPINTHGVARFAVEEYDRALAAVRLGLRDE